MELTHTGVRISGEDREREKNALKSLAARETSWKPCNLAGHRELNAMYVLKYLKGPRNSWAESSSETVDVEHRLACSGELYDR